MLYKSCTNRFALLRQSVDQVYQELQQAHAVVSSDTNASVAVCIQSSLFVQLNCTCNCLVQQNCVRQINIAIQVYIAQQNANRLW